MKHTQLISPRPGKARIEVAVREFRAAREAFRKAEDALDAAKAELDALESVGVDLTQFGLTKAERTDVYVTADQFIGLPKAAKEFLSRLSVRINKETTTTLLVIAPKTEITPRTSRWWK